MKTFEPNKTITELGIDTTRKFVVVNECGFFKKGDILTLIRDDDTVFPGFRNQHGQESYYYLSYLAYYEEEMKEGDYVYVSDESEKDALEGKIKRILLRKCNNGIVCIDISSKQDFLNGNVFETTIWKYAVPIPKTKTITLEVTEEQEREINNFLNK